MDMATQYRAGRGNYYFGLSKDSEDRVYAETKLPIPGTGIFSMTASTLLGYATNEDGITEKIARIIR